MPLQKKYCSIAEKKYTQYILKYSRQIENKNAQKEKVKCWLVNWLTIKLLPTCRLIQYVIWIGNFHFNPHNRRKVESISVWCLLGLPALEYKKYSTKNLMNNFYVRDGVPRPFGPFGIRLYEHIIYNSIPPYVIISGACKVRSVGKKMGSFLLATVGQKTTLGSIRRKFLSHCLWMDGKTKFA